jgi:ribosomal protein L22
MSADKPADEQPPEKEPQAKTSEQDKPVDKSKVAAAGKPASEKSTTAKKSPEAKGDDAAETKVPAAAAKDSATEGGAAKKATAKKPAAKAAKQDEPESAQSKASAKQSAAKEQTESKPAEKAAAEAEKSQVAKPEKPAVAQAKKPTTATRRDSEPADSTSRRKVVRAQARYVRTSARKARMVCGHLRGKSVGEARAILAFTPREVARDWSKLLESAVANAENNHELVEEDLLVREAYADEGPTIKRFRPRAQGRATPIRKRTSHLTITLTPKP